MKRSRPLQCLSALWWTLSLPLVIPLAWAFPINGGDALWVAQSSRALVGCARDGVWSSCPGTFQFGWLQHIPGIFLAWKGMDDNSIVTMLTLINFVALAWMTRSIFRRFPQDHPVAWLSATVVLLGPLYAFSVYSFSEGLLLALLVSLFLALWDDRRLSVIFVLSLLVASSKETAISIVLSLAVAVWLVQSRPRRDVLRQAFAVVAGSTLGLVSVLLFNVWKYGSFQNAHYTAPFRRVTDFQIAVKNFFAIWISPSGGVLPFWFIGGLCAIGVPLLVTLRRDSAPRRRLAGLVLIAILASQTGILALWYAPFGWVTWGPRLILPIAGLVVFASLVMFENEVVLALKSVKYRLVLVGVISLTSIVSGIASLGFILDRSATMSWFNPPLLPSCPQTANVELDAKYYFSCALDFAPWQLGRTLWDSGLHQVTRGWGSLYVVVAVMLFVSIFATVSRHAVCDDHQPTSH